MHKLCLVCAVALVSIASLAAKDEVSEPATRTVSGTQIGHYKNGPVPIDLSLVQIAALVPNGSGGYNVFTGTGTSAGTFTIPGVPSGFYLLQFGGNYLWTSNTTVDADFIADYRSDIVLANSSTTLTFDLVNLKSWQGTDVFEMVCPNNLTYDSYPGMTGETSFTGTFNYFGSLSDASEGDQYYVAQLSTQNVGGLPFTALSRFLAPPKFTQAQGSDTPINGSLKTVAQNNQFEANINGADILTQALAANPNATLAFSGISLDVYPGSFAHGQNTDTPDLVLYGGVPTISTNGDLGVVSYGNPYPSAKFPLYASYEYAGQTPYLAPGATNTTSITTVAFGSTTNLPTASSAIEPLVSVVNSPSVMGLNFFTNHRGIGLTPSLKWSPPSVGPATYYVVNIAQLSNVGGNTVATGIAAFRTQKTSLRIPPGLLSTGQAYVFAISAFYIPGLNFAKTPYYLGSTTARADVISGMMQP
jgi:hypothetical protein